MNLRERIHSRGAIRQRVRVKGVVQGVGFRPYVYGLATKLGLTGFVGNDSSGVFIELQGDAAAVEQFLHTLQTAPPPLARIDSIQIESIATNGDTTFVIVESAAQPDAHTLISPDLCICDDCLRELFDPNDRRYRYPFINCTNCGPRFTIIRDIPYDRPYTTMADFPICPSCDGEYHDPLNRRFHAQPNACPDCGPQVSFYTEGSVQAIADEAMVAAQQALSEGQILAVKGLGGFHLACDATNESAVSTLRERKGRRDKPFAVMVDSIAMAQTIAHLNDEEIALLQSRERPIVLLHKRADSPLVDPAAPDNPMIGLMLPYTPLHYLLLDKLGVPLVMTSGNYTEEPIVTDNEQAIRKLGTIADAFLLHNRDIHVPCDDSVVRAFEKHELPVRRSRGYAPYPVHLPFDVPPLLAVGGELKNTFCVAGGDHAFMGQHIGDMGSLETLNAFEKSVHHMQTLFRIQPERIVCDMHPGYMATQWAEKHAQIYHLSLVKIQHHHAHIAAVMVENGHRGDSPVIGFSFDGTGYGTDGAIWGGEALLADYHDFTRTAHLAYMPLPGGDAGIKRPYRLALAYLWACGIDWAEDLPPVQAADSTEQRVLRRQLETGLNLAQTSSMGRLFDVVSSLIDLRHTITYEAQAAIQLEHVAVHQSTDMNYAFGLQSKDAGTMQIDPALILQAIINDLRAGVSSGIIAGRFHAAVADMVLSISEQLRHKHGIHQVALSGGVFQNVHLLSITLNRLRHHGFEVLIHKQVPPNDGGLALGQAVIGAHQQN